MLLQIKRLNTHPFRANSPQALIISKLNFCSTLGQSYSNLPRNGSPNTKGISNP